MKFKRLENHIEDWVGNPEEATTLIKGYTSWKLNKLASEDVSIVHQSIGSNVCDFINHELPSCSSMKKLLVNIASRNIRVKHLQQVLDYSRVSISNYKKLSWNELIKKNWSVSFQQQRISTEEIKEIKEFLLECCPVRSGDRRSIKVSAMERAPRHTQSITDEALYKLYVAQFSAEVCSLYSVIVQWSIQEYLLFNPMYWVVISGKASVFKEICFFPYAKRDSTWKVPY